MGALMFVKIDNVEVNYIDTGYDEGGIKAAEEKAQTALLLHGWGSNITLFDKTISLLSSKYRVIALDMPGFGESQPPTDAWDIDGYVSFVERFLEEIKARPNVLLGHSFGGRVIIKGVTKQEPVFSPEKIVLVDSAGIKPKRTLKGKLRGYVFKIGKWVFSLGFMQKIYPEELEKWRKKFGSADYNAATPLMRQVLVKTVNEDLTEHLPKIKQPTLLVWGENDTATPISDAKIMESLIPDSGLVNIKGAGHYSFLEQPALFGKVISSFLEV